MQRLSDVMSNVNLTLHRRLVPAGGVTRQTHKHVHTFTQQQKKQSMMGVEKSWAQVSLISVFLGINEVALVTLFAADILYKNSEEMFTALLRKIAEVYWCFGVHCISVFWSLCLLEYSTEKSTAWGVGGFWGRNP